VSDNNLTLEQYDELVNLSLYRTFVPFDGQKLLHQALFDLGCKVLFLQCGRGWSKTFTAVYLAAKWAMCFPDQSVLYLAPQFKQAKKIVWYNKLFEQFIDAETFIERKDKQECFYQLVNGSMIDIDGSDNFDSQRGLKPNLVVADEYAEFNEEWVDVMFPNIIKSRGSIFFMGTPPRFPVLANGRDHHYVTWRNYVKDHMKDNPERFFHIQLPTWNNPYADKTELAEEKKRLISLDMGHVWRREYGAEIVQGAQSQVFKKYSAQRHNILQESILDMVHNDMNRFEYCVSADPGTKSCFAVLFGVLDRFDSKLYLVDEIYETDSAFTTTRHIMPEILEKMRAINPFLDEWVCVADQAAAWFIAEVIDWFESKEAYEWFETNEMEYSALFFDPTDKRVGDKDEGIALIKDLLNEKEEWIAEECENFILELVNYQTDKRGRYIKLADHALDCARYMLKRMMFSFKNETPEVMPEYDKPRGWSSVADQYKAWRQKRDWTYGIEH